MPGLCGIISKAPKDPNETDLKAMLQCMAHEPFHVSGSYSNAELGVYAGWVCHEGSFCDCMPVWNEKRTIALIFFGENFTDLEFFDRLKAGHHRFDPSNASYIVHMYEEKGPGFVRDLNGWFSGLLIDTLARKILLFNDRYGLQRVFYHESADAFIFASEAKALLRIRPHLGSIDSRGLGEFLVCDCVLEHRTLFKDVHLLPGASSWTVKQDGSVTKRSYFNPDVWENQPWLEQEFFYETLKETFSKILPRYFRTARNIGISVTGGLDSRILVAHADLPEGKYPCYTFDGPGRDSADVTLGRKVAQACRQSHQVLKLGRDFLADFGSYAEKTVWVSDGCAHATESCGVILNRKARDIAPIGMTGYFGGDVLRADGGSLLASLPGGSVFSPDLDSHLKNAVETVMRLNASVKNPLSFNLFDKTSWFRNNGLLLGQSELTLRSPYLDTDLVALIYRAPLDARSGRRLSLRLIRDGNTALSEIPTGAESGGTNRFPASLLAGMHRRFLTHSDLAFGRRGPARAARPGRHVLACRESADFRTWFRKDLSGYVHDILGDAAASSRPFINRKAVQQRIDDHTGGRRDHTAEIGRLLTLELICRLFIDGRSPL